jgi:hypothetical protein
MRVRSIALTFAVCVAGVFGVPQSPAPALPQQGEAIDFDALRGQAAAALNALLQSHEQRVALVASPQF